MKNTAEQIVDRLQARANMGAMKNLQASLRFGRRMGFQLTPEQEALANAKDIEICDCIGCRSGVSCFTLRIPA